MYSRFLFYLLLTFSHSAFAIDVPIYIRPEHKSSLINYLKANPSRQVAPKEICSCSESLIKVIASDPNYQPYYAVGDINDDGIEDFAVATIDKSKLEIETPDINVVIFHGPFTAQKPRKGTVAVKNYIINRPEQVLSVFESKVEYGYRYAARLDLGPGIFGSDDIWLIYYDWKKRKYLVKYFYSE